MILEIIAQVPEQPHGLGQIASAAKLHPATCARILKTLIASNYIEQIAPRNGYILGPMAYALAGGGSYRKDLVSLAEPIMRKLSRSLNYPIILAAWYRTERVIISQLNAGETTPARFRPVPTNPYKSATGRLMAAYLSEAQRRELDQRYPRPTNDWPEISSPAKLLKALEDIRASGLALRHSGETIGIAFPITIGDTVPASLGTFLPESNFHGRQRERLLSQMRSAAKSISANINKSKPEHLTPSL